MNNENGISDEYNVSITTANETVIYAKTGVLEGFLPTPPGTQATTIERVQVPLDSDSDGDLTIRFLGRGINLKTHIEITVLELGKAC